MAIITITIISYILLIIGRVSKAMLWLPYCYDIIKINGNYAQFICTHAYGFDSVHPYVASFWREEPRSIGQQKHQTEEYKICQIQGT